MTKKLSAPGTVMMLAISTGVFATVARRRSRVIPDAPSETPVPPLVVDAHIPWLERASYYLVTLFVAEVMFGVIIVFCTNLLR